MRFSIIFLTYLAAVALGSLAANAQPLTDVDAARVSLAGGDEAAAARDLRAAAKELRTRASDPDTAAPDELRVIARALAHIGTETEMGTLDEAELDRQLAVVMRAVARHHLAVARAALRAGEAARASDELAASLDAFERAYRWHGLSGAAVASASSPHDVHELERALALAAEVRSALHAALAGVNADHHAEL